MRATTVNIPFLFFGLARHWPRVVQVEFEQISSLACVQEPTSPKSWGKNGGIDLRTMPKPNVDRSSAPTSISLMNQERSSLEKGGSGGGGGGGGRMEGNNRRRKIGKTERGSVD